MRKALFFVLFLCSCTPFLCACASDDASRADTSGGDPVYVSKELYYNRDSLLYYAKLAYLEDDPKGLFVTAVASYLKSSDPDFPEYCTTVPRDEADIMLLHAAELGYEDAIRAIRCLDKNNCWHHSLPDSITLQK